MAFSLLIAPIRGSGPKRSGSRREWRAARRGAREPLKILADHVDEVIGHVVGQAADPDVAGVHAGAGRSLQRCRECPRAYQRRRRRRSSLPMSRPVVPSHTRWLADPLQLDHQHADVAGPLRHLDAQKLFHREDVGQVVGERRQVVHPVDDRDGLLPREVLRRLFDAGMQEADLRARNRRSARPSSSSISRSTPWVLGWCGPTLMIMRSPSADSTRYPRGSGCSKGRPAGSSLAILQPYLSPASFGAWKRFFSAANRASSFSRGPLNG